MNNDHQEKGGNNNPSKQQQEEMVLSPRLLLFLQIALATGLRKSEIASLLLAESGTEPGVSRG